MANSNDSGVLSGSGGTGEGGLPGFKVKDKIKVLPFLDGVGILMICGGKNRVTC